MKVCCNTVRCVSTAVLNIVELQVHGLRSACLAQLIGNITIDTALEYYCMADACTELTLMDACIQFMAQPENR